MFRIFINSTISTRFCCTNFSKFNIRFTTPNDREKLEILLKRGFHEDENLIKMLDLSYEETKPLYDKILSNNFTINNSLCAVNKDNDEICATIIFKLLTREDESNNYVDKKEEQHLKNIIDNNEKLKKCFKIQEECCKDVWKVFPSDIKAVWKTFMLAVLPEYRKMKIASLIMKSREKLCPERFPNLYGDIADCTTLTSVKIQNNCGYKNYSKVPYSYIGLPPAPDGSDCVIGNYKIFPHYYEKK
ncbi:Acyl-CoA N-acyltransferase domain-containing protein [Strongyloides ratti]|uniref:Acyl-CoA N-acyltransferase domain-containing protein n=1 Tax=Strongyloides ratti TaxID=34506 RepID=A0A090LJQ5_STRRB|nr:Acyl-CoA N-acyltransferase domain-containing protein [Strongyloides ratti]CEF69948.1 Acyl-CoA N-acyltransferase domain-containing protein [Strongyloides ratti]